MLTATEHREMVGRNIMLAREALGLRPTEFARRVQLKPPALWNMETGAAYPNPLTIVRMCEEFGFTADWFLRGLRAGLPHDLASKLQQAESRLPDAA